MKKTVLFIIALSFIAMCRTYAMVPIIKADLSQKTGIAPAFFGPNAFPIPEMSTGIVPSGVSVDISGDVYKGFICPGAKDMTYDMYINLRIPLYRNRVGLYIWMVPQEWYSMDKAVIDRAIDEALRQCAEQGIRGKETTPFLLAKVSELTGGDSLESNIKLVLNNAALAADTASALCDKQSK